MFKQIKDYVALIDQEPLPTKTFYRYLLPLNILLPHIVEFILLVKMWLERKNYKRHKRSMRYYILVLFLFCSWYFTLRLRGWFLTHVTTVYIGLHLFEMIISTIVSIILFMLIKKWLSQGINYATLKKGEQNDRP